MRESEFIVGEVSKSYVHGEPVSLELLSNMFERMITFNLERGYTLHSWAMHRVFDDASATLNETIIAVFRKLKQV